MKIIFTIDIDWANETVINDTLNLFKVNNINCTVFATHKSKAIDLCDKKMFEIGIHPNFNKSLVSGAGLSAEKIVNELTQIYPDAIGVRSHSLTTSSPLLEIFKSAGMKYESNQINPYSKKIEPYKCWNGMTIMPYNFEDDIHYSYNKSFNISLLEEFKTSEYLIMDFHPIHIYLNSDCSETYERARDFFQSDELIKFKNTTHFGTRDLLLRTFDEIKKGNLETYHLKDLIL